MTWEVGTRKSVFLEGGIALFFCLLSFLVRFPHFFRAVHDWDESSFILMGSSVLDGHLPYTDILDIKPPLLWWTSGAILGVLGKSVLSFRVGGTICLALAAYFTYRAGRNFFEPSVGGIAAISLILFVGVCPGGVATMSEHIALVPLSLSLFLLSAYELRPSRAFCAGLAMGAACMVRMNLAYAAVALGLGLLARNSFLKPSGSRLRIVKDWAFWLYVLGGFLAVLVTTLPYLATGSIWHWWNGAVTTSLEYSNSQLTTPAIFIRQVQKVLEAPFNTSMSPSVGIWYGIWLGASFGLARVLYQWRASITNGSFLVLFLLGGVQVSFLRGGVFYAHYSMQLAPALCLLASFFLIGFYRKLRPEAYLILLVLLVEFGVREYRDYRILMSRPAPTAPFGRPYILSDFLSAENPKHEPVWLLSDQLAYFLSGSPPVHRVIHPTNLLRDFSLRSWLGPESNKRTELKNILDRRPLFIIGSRVDDFYTEPLRSYFQGRLRAEYRKEEDLDGLQVYRRL